MGLFSKKQDDKAAENGNETPKKKRGRPRKGEEKKKQEEKRIWTKHERYFVLGVLVITILIPGFLALAARSWKLPNLPRLEVPNDAFKDTFVIEKKVDQNSADEIVKEFKNKTNNLSGVYGFKVINLETGESYGYLESKEYQAASLIKLPLMSLVFKESELNKLNLESVHSLKEEEKIGGSGSLQYADDGEILTIRELVELMGKASDNTAFNILVNKIGEDYFQDYIQKIGMTSTSYETNMTTIDDVAMFFKKLWEARLVNEDNKERLLSYLINTNYESHLPKGGREGTAVAHKYGRELHVVNDAGIFLTDGPFVVVIMTKGVVEKEADQVFPELARLLYEYETTR